jgi:hypothetical protein
MRFATKTQLAPAMLERFWVSGHTAGWVTGDEVYGGNQALLSVIAMHGTGYVMAVSCRTEVHTPGGKFRVDLLMRKVPRRGWQQLSAGAGAKGPRRYDWAAVDLIPTHSAGTCQLLIRRNRTTGLLPLFQPAASSAARPGPRRRNPLEDRGDLPGRQGPRRPG